MATAFPWQMIAKSVVSKLRCWIVVFASNLAVLPTSSSDRAWSKIIRGPANSGGGGSLLSF